MDATMDKILRLDELKGQFVGTNQVEGIVQLPDTAGLSKWYFDHLSAVGDAADVKSVGKAVRQQFIFKHIICDDTTKEDDMLDTLKTMVHKNGHRKGLKHRPAAPSFADRCEYHEHADDEKCSN
jgi:hypothetical protein